MNRILVSVAVVLFMALLPSLAGAAPSQPLGGLDLDGYCRSTGSPGAYLTGAQIGQQAAYANWSCQGQTARISIEQACQWQYSIRAVLAIPSNPDDAFTWQCFAAGP